MRVHASAAAAGGLVLLLSPAQAGPWAETGDAALRSNVELLASAGLVDNVTTQWPLPWEGLMDRLSDPGALTAQPDYIRQVAERLRARGLAETAGNSVHSAIVIDAASSPAFVRGYDALGRQTFQAGGSVEYVWDTTTVHLSFGAQTVNKHDRQAFTPDGSYVAQRLGGTIVYAGYMPHWWGSGWISALALSTNARPVPQVGISRISTAPFQSPWLSWIGPWQAEFFVGVLDGPRVARNTIYDGLRVAFSPLQGLELGVSRTNEMCGTGHTCNPLKGYFDPRNDPSHVNAVNDELTFDIRYSGRAGNFSYALYTQLMNEDSNPLTHSGTVHLFGTTLFAPMWDGIGRFTMEYTDSVATRDLWGGGTFPGFAYNNADYVDGMRYRGRTLGFSLDSDSRLFSLQADFTDSADRSFRLTYHHAEVSTAQNLSGNAVTSAPVFINMLQARVSLPLEFTERPVRFEVEGRLQDDQPRPAKGALATIEAAVRFGL